jgi:Zn-dependent protease with chaperone function
VTKQTPGRLVLVALIVLGCAAWASAQGNRGQERKEDPKLRAAEKARAERDSRRYDKLRAFALTLYQTDLDFRDEVDEHYDDVQRRHSEDAFDLNVAPPARPSVVHDGDRLRLYTGLYDNKLVADYINRVGQRLVPADSEKLFAFRLVADPRPIAYALSTGTIYISTGLVSLLDNEAQLGYVLAHEMAHVQLDHWKLKSTLLLAEDDFNKKEGAKRRLIGLGIGAVAGVVGGAATGGDAAAIAQMGVAGASIGLAVGSAWAEALKLEWDTVQENEADEAAFRAIANQRYELREVPKLYATLQRAVKQDSRVGLAFMGNRRRTAERLANAEDMIARSLIPPPAAGESKLVVTHPDFVRVMATLKRDNGILSFYHDMFQLARSNLEYARINRPNDPAAHYYYGKVMKLVGRTDEDRQLADEAFQRAIQFDHRERNYGAHFYRALALIDQKNARLNPEIAKELQQYLMASIRFASEEAELANALPANLDDLYDFLTEVGDITWRPTVPDTVRSAVKQVSTETQKPESPLNRAQPASAPAKPAPTPATKR